MLAPQHIWVWHYHLSIKPARAQKRGIEHIRAICRSNKDYTLISLEPVHLNQ